MLPIFTYVTILWKYIIQSHQYKINLGQRTKRKTKMADSFALIQFQALFFSSSSFFSFLFFFLPSGKFQFIRDTSLSFLLILYPDYCYCWLADRETSEEDRRRGKGEWNSWSGLNSGNCIFRRKARRLWTLGNYSWPSKVNWRTQK